MARLVTAVLLTFLLLMATSPARAASLVNGSFESPVLAANTFCVSTVAPFCPTITGWTGSVVFVLNGAPPQITPPSPLPDGVQFSLVQADGFMEQAILFDVAGIYRLSWFDAGRAAFIGADGNETYDVLFAGNVLGSFATVTGSAWAPHSVFLSAGAGTFTVRIAGTKPFSQGSDSALFDHFVLQPADVPEPTTLAMDSAALAIFASWRRFARRRSGP